MVRDIRGRFAGSELTEEERRHCPRYPDVGCPDDIAIECLRDGSANYCGDRL